MVDAASAREDAEDATAVATLRERQEQERVFVENYLKQRRAAKLNEELDQVAEDTRHVCMQHPWQKLLTLLLLAMPGVHYQYSSNQRCRNSNSRSGCLVCCGWDSACNVLIGLRSSRSSSGSVRRSWPPRKRRRRHDGKSEAPSAPHVCCCQRGKCMQHARSWIYELVLMTLSQQAV